MLQRSHLFVRSLSALTLVSAAAAQATLVAHYEMNETSGTTCFDSSGNGNDGTYTGGATLGFAGAAASSGTAVDFDGATAFVDIPGSLSLDALSSNFTIAAWIDPNIVQLQRVFSNRRPNGSGSGGSFAFGTVPNGLRFTTLDIQDYDQPANVVCCAYTHIAVVFDAGFTATFYLDGVAVGSVPGGQAANAPGSSDQYLIGVLDLGAGPAEWFEGRIDDVQVYSGALSPADIQALFTNPGSTLGGGLGTPYCGPAAPNASGSPATISASGSPIVANDDLTLTASSVPINSFGFFLTSRTQAFVVGPGGSAGNLCLGGAIGRYVGPGQIQNAGQAGAFDLAIMPSQTPTPTGFVAILAGETWNFQAWFRDSAGGMATSNFTDGLEVSFL